MHYDKQLADRGLSAWLPPGKRAAICFSLDDVHPSTSADAYEAGGDLGSGVLRYIERLHERHAQLRTTLFVTPDWRPNRLKRSVWYARLPVLRDSTYHVDLHDDGRFRLDRHPRFVRYLNAMPGVEIAPHGLHHVHRGPRLAVEFQEQDRATCVAILERATALFDAAGVRYVRGFAPPGWNAPEALIDALGELGFTYLCSARDLRTPASPTATATMSGIRGVALLRPQRVGPGPLQHIPVNFQATSAFDRAHRIIECNGLLSIKAHAFKQGGGHTLLDGLDDRYFEYLDRLFSELEARYGETLWWASMGEIAAASARALQTAPGSNVVMSSNLHSKRPCVAILAANERGHTPAQGIEHGNE